MVLILTLTFVFEFVFGWLVVCRVAFADLDPLLSEGLRSVDAKRRTTNRPAPGGAEGFGRCEGRTVPCVRWRLLRWAWFGAVGLRVF
jgi:hypothetical protein